MKLKVVAITSLQLTLDDRHQLTSHPERFLTLFPAEQLTGFNRLYVTLGMVTRIQTLRIARAGAQDSTNKVSDGAGHRFSGGVLAALGTPRVEDDYVLTDQAAADQLAKFSEALQTSILNLIWLDDRGRATRIGNILNISVGIH